MQGLSRHNRAKHNTHLSAVTISLRRRVLHTNIITCKICTIRGDVLIRASDPQPSFRVPKLLLPFRTAGKSGHSALFHIIELHKCVSGYILYWRVFAYHVYYELVTTYCTVHKLTSTQTRVHKLKHVYTSERSSFLRI